MNEDGHSCALDGERQGAEDGGRKSLAEKFHRLGSYFTLGPGSFLFRQAANHQHQGPRRLRVRPCENLHDLPGMPSERRRLLIDQRDLYQLHVDCKTQSPVELIEQRGFPA